MVLQLQWQITHSGTLSAMRLTIDHCINECGDERAMSSAFHEQHRGHVARPFHQNHNEKLLSF